MLTTTENVPSQCNDYKKISSLENQLNHHSTGEEVLKKYSINKGASGREQFVVPGLEGKVCIVTGGSSGLGSETVKMMLLGKLVRI